MRSEPASLDDDRFGAPALNSLHLKGRPYRLGNERQADKTGGTRRMPPTFRSFPESTGFASMIFVTNVCGLRSYRGKRLDYT
jgi:hypothetical protein